MLFIIEEDIVMANDEHFLNCFENLLLGYIEGSHLLYIKPKVVDLITKKYNEKMDDRMKNQFYHYQEKFMFESKMALKLVNYAIKIVPQSTIEDTTKIDEKLIVGNLHTNKFLSSANIQKTILLGENPSDGDIYEIFAKEYIKLNKSTLKIKLKIENGGGSTTGSTFARKISTNEELCLCILDSDKKFPSDARGATAKKVIKETRYIMTPKYDYYIEDKCRVEW